MSILTKLWMAVFIVVVAWVAYLDVSAERTAADASTYPVMILGFDGMDPEFFEYYLSQGKLPNFRRLVDEGAYAPLQTFKPTKSVVLWTSVATGKRMEKHGIVDWQLLSEDGKRKVLASGQSRRTEALWNIATDGGKTVQVLNWWATWPAEEVSGEIVSNHFPRSLHADVADATYPPALAKELAALGLPGREDANRAIHAAGMPVYSRELANSAFLPSTNFRARFQTAAGVFNDDMITERSLEHLMASRGQADLVQALFRTIDVYTHFMWRFIERRVARPAYDDLRGKGLPVTEEVSRTMKEAYARVLEPVYVHEDRRLGRLMEQAGPETVLFVLSDHGFQFRNYGFNHYDDGRGGVRAPSGVMFLWGPPVRSGVGLDHPTLFDVAPTALYLMGLPAGRDMDGRVLTEALRPKLMAAREPAWVDSHDDGSRQGGTAESPVDEEVLRELEALGYIR
jgi:predicted AlkP superfamily phosphohydrolase/phosphomutase